VAIDGFTKYFRLYATKTTITKKVIIALKDYFRSYSRPTCIVSVRGSCFTSEDFRKFMEESNIKHVKNYTY